MSSYETPDIKDYGTLADLTQTAGVFNRDTPNGPNNTAFPPGS
jgi:hypothetical protein